MTDSRPLSPERDTLIKLFSRNEGDTEIIDELIGAIVIAARASAEPEGLDAAWAAAEAAVDPPGRSWGDALGLTLRGPRDEHTGYMASSGDDFRGYGPTPAAALLALAKRLSQEPET